MATACKANEKEAVVCPGCIGCTEDFIFPEVKDTNFSQFDDNPLPLIPPPKVDMSQHNDLSKDTKKPSQPIPFSLNSSGGNGFSFGAAIAAATANTTTTNSTPQGGLFFGNNSFKFSTSAQDGGASGNGDSKNGGNLFGGNVTKPTMTITSSSSSAETIKPAFSFGSSTVFGGLQSMFAFPIL